MPCNAQLSSIPHIAKIAYVLPTGGEKELGPNIAITCTAVNKGSDQEEMSMMHI